MPTSPPNDPTTPTSPPQPTSQFPPTPQLAVNSRPFDSRDPQNVVWPNDRLLLAGEDLWKPHNAEWNRQICAIARHQLFRHYSFAGTSTTSKVKVKVNDKRILAGRAPTNKILKSQPAANKRPSSNMGAIRTHDTNTYKLSPNDLLDMANMPPPSKPLSKMAEPQPKKSPWEYDLPPLDTLPQLKRPSSTLTATAKAVVKNIRIKRRPSQIFNMNFSFSQPSRRGAVDCTPEVSPRSSLSADTSPMSQPAAPTLPQEPVKRQRIDSSSSGKILRLSFNRSASKKKSKSRDASKPATPTIEAIDLKTKQQIQLQAAFFCSPPPQHSDPHPGHLVEYSAFDYDAERAYLGRSSLSNDLKIDINHETYSSYFAMSPRRRSFPSEECLLRSLKREEKVRNTVARLEQESRSFTPAHLLPSTKESNVKAPLQKQCEFTTPYNTLCSTPPYTRTASNSSGATLASSNTPATPKSTRALSASSNPDYDLNKTAIAVLQQIRASMSRRASAAAEAEAAREIKTKVKQQSYSVFEDEEERGFFAADDLPL